MPKMIDLNCDMGESYGRWTLGADEAIMPFITSANVACGFHGGDPHVMRRTVDLAVKHGVAIGSHPGLPDLISVQTICCHGDTPGAEKIVRAVREGLEKAGCQVRPLRDWLPAK
jgi:lactam utilization protein B